MGFKKGLKNYLIGVVIVVVIIGAFQFFAINGIINTFGSSENKKILDIPKTISLGENPIVNDNVEKSNKELCIEGCSPNKLLFYDISYEANIKDKALFCVCENGNNPLTSVYDLNKKLWIQRRQ